MRSNGNAAPLASGVRIQADKILNPETPRSAIGPDEPLLLLLAAGKGTRFGTSPKCITPVCGVPLAEHSIEAFAPLSRSPALVLVGYRHDEVTAALGNRNIYVRSDNPTGGTAYAALEAFSVAELLDSNPIVVVSMGDRVVPTSVFRRLLETHRGGPCEADLTLLTASYEPPNHHGRGRVVRNGNGRVARIVEQRDLDAMPKSDARDRLLEATEGNCPVYAVRAQTLFRYLSQVDNDNAQGQYYFTDIVAALHADGGDLRSIHTQVGDPEYDVLCSDVTRPRDVAVLESLLAVPDWALRGTSLHSQVQAIVKDRPPGQVASIAAQLEELLSAAATEQPFRHDEPLAIGISGGRLRVAFMHPDMGRFYGPAWQMPIGAADPEGREQVVVLLQSAGDHKIHLHTTNPELREKVGFVPAHEDYMYPGEDVSDWYSYEDFGTQMAKNLLLSLGYFSDEEIQARRDANEPLPPSSLWVSNSMRRPFSLLANAIASMRTLREGNLGASVQDALGREQFGGLRVISTGSIPQGGFSSSSAVTVAVKNGLNSLYDLQMGPDLLVQLACQAEYGTGVRAGALDQATEQKGRAGEGALISSNPRDNYRILGTFPVPAERFRVLFPYSVDRDKAAWQWSAGTYSATPEDGRLTSAEMRKMTGKAAEIAALLCRLPLDRDFFQDIESELLEDGVLTPSTRMSVCGVLGQLPLRVRQSDLKEQLFECRDWYVDQLMTANQLKRSAAEETADNTLASLLAGWRDPRLSRLNEHGEVREETGAPLRAMVGYLYGEVAKNCYLIHHPDEWIECVSRSQRGDRCFDIPHEALPERSVLTSTLDWEKSLSGPLLMNRWLERYAATPFDFNRGLDDQSLRREPPRPFYELAGSNFFRGLALIDLAEAMLKRAFGEQSVAVRVNAAGQGDFFQVHVDTERVAAEEVKEFIRTAFYQRFSLTPRQDFVEPHPGGGAVGLRLDRFSRLGDLVAALRDYLSSAADQQRRLAFAN